MNINEEVIQKFYSAFAKLDHVTMQDCYADDAIFNDPVFGILQGDEVKCMWEMLCKKAKEFSLQFNSIQSDEEYGTCEWTAKYRFSKTGRKVVNKVKAHLRFRDRRIIEHTDEFDIYKWSRQALGLSGVLLGWSGYLKNKIRYDAKRSLQKFMEQPA
jgi:ketosteroid isomerase-like protein